MAFGKRSVISFGKARVFLKQEWTLPSSTVSFIRSGFVKMHGQQSHPHPPPSLYGSQTLATAVGLIEVTQPNGITERFLLVVERLPPRSLKHSGVLQEGIKCPVYSHKETGLAI